MQRNKKSWNWHEGSSTHQKKSQADCRDVWESEALTPDVGTSTHTGVHMCRGLSTDSAWSPDYALGMIYYILLYAVNIFVNVWANDIFINKIYF